MGKYKGKIGVIQEYMDVWTCISTVGSPVSIRRVQKIQEGSRGLQCNKWEMGQGKIIWLESYVHTV
jgi:hypothetical protein